MPDTLRPIDERPDVLDGIPIGYLGPEDHPAIGILAATRAPEVQEPPMYDLADLKPVGKHPGADWRRRQPLSWFRGEDDQGAIYFEVIDELSAFSLGDLRPIDEAVLRARSRQAPAVTEGPGGKLEATRGRTTYRWYRAMLHREPPAD
jgi:hypothetical protein